MRAIEREGGVKRERKRGERRQRVRAHGEVAATAGSAAVRWGSVAVPEEGTGKQGAMPRPSVGDVLTAASVAAGRRRERDEEAAWLARDHAAISAPGQKQGKTRVMLVLTGEWAIIILHPRKAKNRNMQFIML